MRYVMCLAIVIGAAGLFTSSVQADPQTLDQFTSFEFTDLDGFTLGAGNQLAQFTGGRAQIIGIPNLYHSGSFAWMLNGGETGVVTFTGLSASVIEFFGASINGPVTVNAYSPTNALIDSLNITDANFGANMNDFSNPLSFSGVGSIGRIELTANAGGANRVSIDSFGFSVVPEPASAGVLTLAGAAILLRRRKR